jgi:hypothetical protein
MIHNPETEVAEIGVRLLDDAYMAWFTAETECARALRTWFDRDAHEPTRGVYYAYLAALDREEAAARDLQRLWELADPCRDTISCGPQGAPK